MSGIGPFGAGDPFGGIPFFADLAKMISKAGPINWDAARQLAHSIVTQGEAEPNVDPLDRIQFEQLGRIAELHVSTITGISLAHVQTEITPVTRTGWVAETFKAYEPLFLSVAEALAPKESSGEAMLPSLDAGDDEASMDAWLNGLMGMLSPMMLGMTAGSMIGHLATRTFGQYDIPIPRPESNTILVVPANLNSFGEEWSLSADELRLWVCLHELTHHALLRLDHVGPHLASLLVRFTGGFTPDSTMLEERLGSLDPTDPSGLSAMQAAFSDPEVLLGASRSEEQRVLLAEIETLASVIVGYVDWVMDSAGNALMGGYGQITEAIRRRRVESANADRFVGQLLGMNLTQAHYDRGNAFIAGVIERGGTSVLERLWLEDGNLPTPAELDAPGLWLARIDLPDIE